MIEREFVKQKKREFQVQEFMSSELKRVGHSKTKIQRTPLGDKIIIHASRPGLIVGRKGANIKQLTKSLKKNFKLDNPQIEISEVIDVNLDPHIVAERISSSMEMYGSNRFKGIGHKVMDDVMRSGALGVEILISGKVPSSRAKRWRFYKGYLKKSGDIAVDGVLKAYQIARLKTGVVGIQVRIMPSDLVLPDDVKLLEKVEEVVEEVTPKKSVEEEVEKKPKTTKKKTTAKKTNKKEKVVDKKPETEVENKDSKNEEEKNEG